MKFEFTVRIVVEGDDVNIAENELNDVTRYMTVEHPAIKSVDIDPDACEVTE